MEEIGIAVIGCGYWGPNILRNFHEEERAMVLYVCDLRQERLNKIKRRYPSVNLTNDYNAVLSDSRVHAVSICTPPHTHYDLARQAVLAGKHVLVEKPMCMTSSECRELIKLSRNKQVVLMVGHTFVYHGAVRKIKTVIESGELGDLLYFDSVRVNLGIFQNDINVIWDLASHDLSILDFLAPREPRSVHASGACHTSNGIEDIGYVTVAFDDNFLANFHVSWLSPVKVRRLLIGGTRKMISYDDLTPLEKVRIYSNHDFHHELESCQEKYQNLIQFRIGDIYVPVIDVTEALKTEISHFIDCIVTGETPLTDGESGLRVVNLLEATNRALKTSMAQSTISVYV